MAMSKLKEDPMDSILQCGYCSQIFQKPKILPCLHTFCEQCIGSAIQAIGKQDVSEFSCPLCRTKVKPLKDDAGIETWAANLKDNLTITAMLASRTGKAYNCGVCDQNGRKLAARFWCNVCQDAFCETCHSFHKSMKILSDHTTVPINEKINAKSGFDISALTSRCVDHPDRNIEVFCSNHKVPCCVMCLTQKHRTCTNIEPIENVKTTLFDSYIDSAADLKQGITNLLKSKQEHKTRVNETLKLAEDDASMFQKLLKCKIDTMFEAYMKKLETFKDEENTKLNVQLRLLEQYEQNLEHWITACTFVKEHGTDQILLQYMDTIKRQILVRSEELKNSFQSVNATTVNIGFVKDANLEKIARAKEIGSLKVENGNVVGLQEQIDSISRSSSSIVGVENATKAKSDRMIEEYIVEKCCADVEGVAFKIAEKEYMQFDEEEDDIQYKYDEKSFKSESKYCNTKKEKALKGIEDPMLYKNEDVYIKYGGLKYSGEIRDACEETKQSSATRYVPQMKEDASRGMNKMLDQRECRKNEPKYECNEKETFTCNMKSVSNDDKVSEPHLKNEIGYEMAKVDVGSKTEKLVQKAQHDRNDLRRYENRVYHGYKEQKGKEERKNTCMNEEREPRQKIWSQNHQTKEKI